MREGDLVAGRYRLLRPIGSGAMGKVWAARHELLGREFALKIAATGDRTTRDARALFLREVQIVGKLRHPNVVDIADAGEIGRGEGLYLAMELLEGQSLAERLATSPLAPTEALAVTAELCRGLAAAHAAGVVHRDIKPENVFLARGAEGGVVPKLLDFGVSSARGIITLSRGRLFATPAYMSPEQALGEGDVDCRADVWAIGVLLYEVLTGRHPFEADSYPALLPLIIEAPHPPLPASIPPEVRAVVDGCLAKDRADRYASAGALREAIDRARAALPAPDPRTTASGFFVETGPDLPVAAPAEPTGAPRAGGARRGLALAILALAAAIVIAAAASGIRRDQPAAVAAPGVPSTIAPSAAPPEAASVPPPIATAAPSASAAAPAASVTATAPAASVTATAPAASVTAAAPPRAPARAPGRPITTVNSAGF